MKNKNLYNQKNKADLINELNKESFKRITCSFYRYVRLDNLSDLRDELFLSWNKMKILGRIYIAEEGINAQMSIPKNKLERFKKNLYSYDYFKNMELKLAVEEGISFLKLTIKIKPEIVAYKVSKEKYNMNVVGKHLDYKKFNEAIDKGAITIDMRNYYEGEIGKFDNAIIPDVDRSQDLLPEVKKILKNNKNDKILLYCTGGIRCEKASSYLIKSGFKDVNQLKGGIIQYAHDIKKNNVKSKFLGKNFVFDKRMGEKITKHVIGNCHQCKDKSDLHQNCNNQACHILFIQCEKCYKKYNGCCSNKCKEFNLLPKEQQKKLFKSGKYKFTAQLSDKIKPKLYEL